jgi:hypothetical protein
VEEGLTISSGHVILRYKEEIMRVVVTGGRTYQNRVHVFHSLDMLDELNPITFLAAGGATGVDTFAREWAEAHGVAWTEYPADWIGLGKMAGPVRNRAMLEQFLPDLVVAFPGGRGTGDCVRKAHMRNISVLKVKG